MNRYFDQKTNALISLLLNFGLERAPTFLPLLPPVEGPRGSPKRKHAVSSGPHVGRTMNHRVRCLLRLVLWWSAPSCRADGETRPGTEIVCCHVSSQKKKERGETGMEFWEGEGNTCEILGSFFGGGRRARRNQTLCRVLGFRVLVLPAKSTKKTKKKKKNKKVQRKVGAKINLFSGEEGVH